MDKVAEKSCEKAGDGSVSPIESLPYEIALEILSRLPIISLMKVKLVSHWWKNLVCDPHLVHMHFSQVSRNDPGLILCANYPAELYFVQNSRCFDSVKRIILRSLKQFKVVGSCNGLLCLFDLEKIKTVYIFNPFARNLLELPKAQVFCGQEGDSLGFGYNPTSKLYKVVWISYYRGYTERGNVQAYNLGSSSWRYIGQTTHQLERMPSDASVNGRLHWMTDAANWKIVSFDLEDEQFRIVEEPEFTLSGKLNTSLVILRGCVSLARYSNNYQKLEIWMMKEYDMKESWNMAFCIGASLPKELNQNGDKSFSLAKEFANVVCILENGEILLDLERTDLVVYNPKSGTFNHFMYPPTDNYFKPTLHFGTLNWFHL